MNANHMVIDDFATRLRWWWRGLALFYLALMVHFAIYHFVQGQCTSTSCVLLALSQIGIGILVIVLALSISLPLTHRLLQHFANIPPGLFLFASATVLFGFGLNLRLEWIYAHMSFALSGIAALAYFSIYGDRLPNVQRRTVVIGMILLVLVVILIRVRALAVDPSIHILDEPWTLSWAVSYLRTGQPSDWIMGSVSGLPLLFVAAILCVSCDMVAISRGRIMGRTALLSYRCCSNEHLYCISGA